MEEKITTKNYITNEKELLSKPHLSKLIMPILLAKGIINSNPNEDKEKFTTKKSITSSRRSINKPDTNNGSRRNLSKKSDLKGSMVSRRSSIH